MKLTSELMVKLEEMKNSQLVSWVLTLSWIRKLLIIIIDVLSIEKTGENFRVLYDVKGRFVLRSITSEEAKVINRIIIWVNISFYSTN